jgi:DNA-binding SARP family transcriptional activator/basic membrane lipoprotein Med (substrate-binding protein (PBP1-ABC) superfamily)
MLGSFEVVRDGRPIALGGSRQQALLIVLLLNRNQAVSVDRLVDDLWPEQPPRTASQVVRVYVSQLRKTIGAEALETVGSAYRLRTEPDDVDADVFERLVAEGTALFRAGDPAAGDRLRDALSLWRGRPLPEVAGEQFAQAPLARLDERRLAALEDLYDADLAAGRSGELVAELEDLVAEHPERERLWAELMLALYRSGRQAEALAAYRRVHRHLDETLGLQPGEQLRLLEARMLRHDPTLLAAAPTVAEPVAATPPPRRRRTTPWLAAAGLVLVAVAALAVALSLHSSSSAGTEQRMRPITLVLFGSPPDPNKPPETSLEQTLDSSLISGLQQGVREHIPGRVAYVGGDNDQQLIDAISRQARRAGMLIIGATPDFGDVAAAARRNPQTRFVIISASIHDADFPHNVTGMKFDDGEVGYLAGYLGALQAGHRSRISAVAGQPTPSVQRIVRGYRAGAQRADPSVHVAVGHTDSFVDQQLCERMANRQIDAGSTIVFDVAGECGLGALQAAGIRGAWGIGVDNDMSALGPQILASSIKHTDSAARLAMELYAAGKLPAGRDLQFNLGNDGVGLVGIDPSVSPQIRDRLETVAAAIRARDQRRDGD